MGEKARVAGREDARPQPLKEPQIPWAVSAQKVSFSSRGIERKLSLSHPVRVCLLHFPSRSLVYRSLTLLSWPWAQAMSVLGQT